LGLAVRVFEIAEPGQVDDALAGVLAQKVDSLVLASDASIWPRRRQIMRIAVARRLPTITDSGWGGVEPLPLLSYRARVDILMRQAAGFVERILWEGAAPGDLPILLPDRFKFVVNLKTARAIGLAVPQSLLLRADEVVR
jgi:putative ABC transport system substrate-binding protein